MSTPESESRNVVPSNEGLGYATAEALDRAISDRISRAADSASQSASELHRQFAYDRLLARLFANDPEGWVLKGGAALLARLPQNARHSLDIDIFRKTSTESVVSDLREAVAADLGDFFSFDVERDRELTGIHPGVRCKVVAYLGDREFERFKVDVVVAGNMTGVPETVSPIAPIDLPGLQTRSYRIYPLADHVADKFAAMNEVYGQGRPSSRYRDLVDLILIATTQSVSASDLQSAILSEFAYRSLDIPRQIALPSAEWRDGYSASATDVAGLAVVDVDEAIDLLRGFLRPVLDGSASGQWDASGHRWREA